MIFAGWGVLEPVHDPEPLPDRLRRLPPPGLAASFFKRGGKPFDRPHSPLDRRNLLSYSEAVIKSFAHKGLERFFYDGSKKGVNPDHARRIGDILDRLDAAVVVQDMAFPGSGLHPLKGDLKGHWAVKVSGNWRVVFRFEDRDAYVVDYRDYH